MPAPNKSTDQLKRQGTYRKDRHGTRATVEKPLDKKPTEFLSPEEKKIWLKWYPILQKNGMLKETDEVAFGLLCKIYQRVETLSPEFRNSNDFITTHISDVGATVTKVDPKYTVMVESEKNLLKLLTEFGMTPVSRSKVKVAMNKGRDPLLELQNEDD